jgi:hypothetical protein
MKSPARDGDRYSDRDWSPGSGTVSLGGACPGTIVPPA